MGDQLRHSSGSFELVLSAAILALVGYAIDRRLGTTPWFTVGLAVFGAVGATVSLYYRYRHRMAELAAEARPVKVDL